MDIKLENKIKEWLIKTNLSQDEISKKIGISQSQVSKVDKKYKIREKKKIENDKKILEEIKKCDKSYVDIGEMFNVSSAYVCKMAKNNGLDRDNKIAKEMREKKIFERYGVKHAQQNKEIREKTHKTNLERYGVEHPAQNKEVHNKMDKTNLQKYGVVNPFQAEEVKEKIKQTNLKRYGVENVGQNDEIMKRARIKYKNIHGVEYPQQTEEFKKKQKQTMLNKYGVEHALQKKEFNDKAKETMKERYGVENAWQLPQVKLGMSNDSKPNKEFEKKLKELGIKYQREFSLESYNYDFKVKDNILVEINPSATHNITWHPFNKQIPKEYHYNKSKTATENGYHCIHIWDWDDQDKIIRLFLQDKKKIYARDCEIKKVDLEETYSFLKEYHLQGYANCELALGLYKGNELVSIMTFGKPRYNKNYDYEIIRLCSKYNVIGGNEKLFKGFTDKIKGSIISYCDSSKFNGEVYKKLGFTLKKSSISKHWYNIKTGKHITDNLLRQRGFDQLMNEHYGKGTSNEELMRNAGFVEIYDCGQQSWVYDKNANN